MTRRPIRTARFLSWVPVRGSRQGPWGDRVETAPRPLYNPAVSFPRKERSTCASSD
jgi:hypothetical protein